ncbi:MAG: cytochrome c, partial [Phormidium sp.]
MDKQLTKPEALIRQLTLLVLALVLAIFLGMMIFHHWQMSDPYIKSVMSLTGDPVRGDAIFQMNCAGCHGLQANGRVGPSLQGISKHKSEISLIQQVISGKTPPMP